MKKLLIILSIIVLSGCSTKFAYKNIDWLVYWYLDDYIDVTDEQEVLFDKHIEKWLAWHKSEELPKYLAHLNELSDDITTRDLSAARIEHHHQQLRAHWERVRDYVSPDLVDLSLTLSNDQITQLFVELNENNQEKIEKRIKLLEKSTPGKRRKEATKNMKDYIGKLSKEQADIIESYLPKFESTFDMWMDYRIEYQSMLQRRLMTREPSTKYKASLLDMLTFPDQFKKAELIAKNEANTILYKAMLVDVGQTLSVKNAEKLQDKINDFNDDIKDLLE